MSKILDNAIAHFKGIEVKKIEVPEWDAVIYAKPFTMSDKSKLLKFARGDDVEFLVRALILKAQDKKGIPLFSLEDKVDLMNNVHPTVLERVVGEISESTSIEEAEKK